MNVLIIGDGKVGYTVAEYLSKEMHDVVIVDNNDEALRRASETLDVMCVQGNGASINVLKKAGVQTADVVIAATSRDEINMICCFIAKKLGAGYTIARIRDMAYAMELNTYKKEMDIDLVINPEQASAVEISRLLSFPSALNIETFYRGRVEMVDFRANEDDFIVGQPISNVMRKYSNLSILFCAIERNNRIIIPNGDIIIRPNDRVYVIGDILGVTHFFKTLGRFSPKIKDIMIVGGGRIASYLTKIVTKMNLRVKIIESNLQRCNELSAEFPDAVIINGDGTDQELLTSENIQNTGAFIALTDRDEYNFISSIYATLCGVQKVIAKANRPNYASVAKSIGIDSVISPKEIASIQILQIVRGLQNSKGSIMESLYKIVGGKAEAMEFIVNKTTRYLGTPLKSLNIKKGIIVVAIARKGKAIIPEGNSFFMEGDNIILIAADHKIADINDIYESQSEPSL